MESAGELKGKKLFTFFFHVGGEIDLVEHGVGRERDVVGISPCVVGV